MKRTTDDILRVALFHFRAVRDYTARDTEEQMVLDAIAMRLSAGIEELNGLEETDLRRLFGRWDRMWGMRNRIAHGYVLVDIDLVTRTATNDIPGVIDTIVAELN